MIISSSGHLSACGNNEFDKLCLNQSGSILDHRRSVQQHHGQAHPVGRGSGERGVRPGHMRVVTEFHSVRATQLRNKQVLKVALGRHHIAVVDVEGRVITSGKNDHGQLGSSASKQHGRAHVVKGALEGVRVSDLLWMWGATGG
jgi:alpha-tubulin suppressor-like RCC1 family protein